MSDLTKKRKHHCCHPPPPPPIFQEKKTPKIKRCIVNGTSRKDEQLNYIIQKMYRELEDESDEDLDTLKSLQHRCDGLQSGCFCFLASAPFDHHEDHSHGQDVLTLFVKWLEREGPVNDGRQRCEFLREQTKRFNIFFYTELLKGLAFPCADVARMISEFMV